MGGIILFFSFIIGLIIIYLSFIYFEKFIVAANISKWVVSILNRLKWEAVESFNDLMKTGVGLLSSGLDFTPDIFPNVRSPT